MCYLAFGLSYFRVFGLSSFHALVLWCFGALVLLCFRYFGLLGYLAAGFASPCFSLLEDLRLYTFVLPSSRACTNGCTSIYNLLRLRASEPSNAGATDTQHLPAHSRLRPHEIAAPLFTASGNRPSLPAVLVTLCIRSCTL